MDTRGQGGGWRTADTPESQRPGRTQHPGIPHPRGRRTRGTHYTPPVRGRGPRPWPRPAAIRPARAGPGHDRPAARAARWPSWRPTWPGRRAARWTRRCPRSRSGPLPAGRRGHRQPSLRGAHRVPERAPRRGETGCSGRCPTSTWSTTPSGPRRPPCSRWGWWTTSPSASTDLAGVQPLRGPKQIEVYPFNGHDGGGTQHFLAKLAFLATCPPGPIHCPPDPAGRPDARAAGLPGRLIPGRPGPRLSGPGWRRRRGSEPAGKTVIDKF